MDLLVVLAHQERYFAVRVEVSGLRDTVVWQNARHHARSTRLSFKHVHTDNRRGFALSCERIGKRADFFK